MKYSKEEISNVILEITTRFIKENEKIKTAYDINNGQCAEFAEELLASLGGKSDTSFILSLDNFMFPDDEDDSFMPLFDVPLIENHWPKIKPPHSLTWYDISKIDFGYHEWICIDGIHYDAECPEGVENIFQLPLFQKYIEEYIKKITNCN